MQSLARTVIAYEIAGIVYVISIQWKIDVQ